MKVIYYVCTIACAMLFNNAAQAYYDSPGGGLSIGINDSSITSTDSYTKYAAVNFISKKFSFGSSDVSDGDDLDTEAIKGTTCGSNETLVDGICINVSECKSSFPLTSVDKTVGKYVSKKCGDTVHYCYTSCATGWSKNGCYCNAVDCSDFPHATTNGHSCNGVKSCKTGDTYRYKCTDCEDGYTLSGGVCVAMTCADRGNTYFDTLTEHCSQHDTQRVGDKQCFKCTECNKDDGWKINHETGKCEPRTCEEGYDKNPVDHCVKNATHKSGNEFCYKCTECNAEDGWVLGNDGKCKPRACDTGFDKNPVDHCVKNATHKSGNEFCYKCTECNAEDGWVLGNDGTCKPRTCDTGFAETLDNHCVKNETHKNGDGFCYKCTECEVGYNLYNNTCAELRCGNYGPTYFETLTDHCKSYDAKRAGDKQCYKCTECDESDGWKLDAKTGTCIAKGCESGYSSAQDTPHCSKYTNYKNGDGYCYKCTECEASDGWVLYQNMCTAKTCEKGYAKTPVDHCVKNDTHKSGDSFCYKCTECNAEDGWVLGDDGTCKPRTCDTGYASAPVAHCVENDTHKNGSEFCYKCTKCDESDGWTLDASTGQCKPKGCDAGYSETPDTHCAAFATHKNGDGFCYKCTQCLDGWKFEGTSSSGAQAFTGGKGKIGEPLTLTTPSCVAKVCDTAAVTSDVLGVPGTIEHCSEYGSVEKAGDGICTSCKICEAGYQLNTLSKKCEAITCENSVEPIEACVEYDSVGITGNKLCYKCKTCATGYELSSDGKTCTAKTCQSNMSSYTSLPAHCTEAFAVFVASDGVCYQGCTKCEPGWSPSSGGCKQVGPSDPAFTTTPPSNCSDISTEDWAGIKYYKCNTCDAGYELSSNGQACVAKDCSSLGIMGSLSPKEHCTEHGAIAISSEGICYGGCSKCEPGWSPSSGGCKQVGPSDSGYTTTPPWNCHNMSTQTWGGIKYYKCEECSLGYMKYTEHDCIEKSIPSGYDGLNHSHCKNLEIGAFGNQTLSRCTECDPGWEVTGIGCAKVTAPSTYSGWSMTYPSHCITFESKRSGSDIYYRCAECEQGYHRYEYKCIADTAPSGWKSSMPNHCTDVTAKLYGDKVKYYCAECASGYYSYGGDCIQSQGNPCCSMSGYACEPMPHCLEFNKIKSLATGLVCFGSTCKKCEQGYEFKNGSCTEVSHSGYSTTKPNDGCSAWKSLLSGNTIYYKCTKCKSGYTSYNATECIPS